MLVLVAAGAAAQGPPAAATTLGRLTVRPQEMATGTQTAEAGTLDLDSLKDFKVYVPESCVGPRRCPLVVGLMVAGLTGAQTEPSSFIGANSQFADSHGVILLAPAMAAPKLGWDVHQAIRADQRSTDPRGLKEPVRVGTFDNIDVRNIDAALKHVLRTFAVDPQKIGLMGYSYGASYALFLGRHNLDIFSRIALLSPTGNWGGTGPQAPATQVFTSAGLKEADEVIQVALRAGQDFRQAGHSVRELLVSRGPLAAPSESPAAWHWLADSWTTPGSSGGTAPAVASAAADSVPLLTTDILNRLTTFWQNFDTKNLAKLASNPDSAESAAAIVAAFATPQAHSVPVMLGEHQVQIENNLDMTTIAAEQPQIDAMLKQTGLTAQQENAYRAALIGAVITLRWGAVTGPVAENSTVAKNVAFVGQHQAEMLVLGRSMPVLKEIR